MSSNNTNLVLWGVSILNRYSFYISKLMGSLNLMSINIKDDIYFQLSRRLLYNECNVVMRQNIWGENMKIIKYNKLIRDRIPEIIESSGKTAIVEKVQGEELLGLLNKKLFEELKEYEESNKVEELADLVEVVQAILDYKGVTIEDFNKIREKKNESRGAFKEGLLLIEVVEE